MRLIFISIECLTKAKRCLMNSNTNAIKRCPYIMSFFSNIWTFSRTLLAVRLTCWLSNYMLRSYPLEMAATVGASSVVSSSSKINVSSGPFSKELLPEPASTYGCAASPWWSTLTEIKIMSTSWDDNIHYRTEYGRRPVAATTGAGRRGRDF